MTFVSLVLMVLYAAPVGAEIVYFPNGRTLSVKSYRIDGRLLVLSLRGGGEITCDASAVARIEPDEVPYPDEEVGREAFSDPVRLGPAPTSAGEGHRRYAEVIEEAAARHGVDAALVRAVIQVESNYQYRARSPKGAKGLMQLMPSTARQYGVTNPYDPVSNIEAGVRHLKSLLARFPLRLALAAYNAGEAAVLRFGGVPPFAETRNYVERVLKLVGRA